MSVVWEKSYMLSAADNSLLCDKCSVVVQQDCPHDALEGTEHE